jgi:hypothetical protein
MPLSVHIASLVKGLAFNLEVFQEKDWPPEVRVRLIDESIAVVDELLLDPVFNLTLQGAYLARAAAGVQIQQLGASPKLLGEFLEKEAFLLKAAGYGDDHAEQLVSEVKRVVAAGLRGVAEPDVVLKSIVGLRFALVAVRDRKQEKRWPKAARSLVMGLGGAALVGLNASALAVTAGLTAPLAAISGVSGGVILEEGARGVIDVLKN